MSETIRLNLLQLKSDAVSSAKERKLFRYIVNNYEAILSDDETLSVLCEVVSDRWERFSVDESYYRFLYNYSHLIDYARIKDKALRLRLSRLHAFVEATIIS